MIAANLVEFATGFGNVKMRTGLPESVTQW